MPILHWPSNYMTNLAKNRFVNNFFSPNKTSLGTIRPPFDRCLIQGVLLSLLFMSTSLLLFPRNEYFEANFLAKKPQIYPNPWEEQSEIWIGSGSSTSSPESPQTSWNRKMLILKSIYQIKISIHLKLF